MTTPVCVGPAFTPGVTLRFAGTQAAPWPYASSCTQAANNGLRLDPTATTPASNTGGLWVDPVNLAAIPPNTVTNTTPQTLTLAADNLSPDMTFTYTNPSCLPQQGILTSVFRCTGNLPLLSYVRFKAAQGLAAASFAGLPYVGACYCWQPMPFVYQLTFTAVRVFSVAASATVTIHRQMLLHHDSVGTGGAHVAGTNTEWDVSTTAMVFNTPSPVAGP